MSLTCASTSVCTVCTIRSIIQNTVCKLHNMQKRSKNTSDSSTHATLASSIEIRHRLTSYHLPIHHPVLPAASRQSKPNPLKKHAEDALFKFRHGPPAFRNGHPCALSLNMDNPEYVCDPAMPLSRAGLHVQRPDRLKSPPACTFITTPPANPGSILSRREIAAALCMRNPGRGLRSTYGKLSFPVFRHLPHESSLNFEMRY